MSLSWLLRSSRILKRLLFGKAEPCTLKAAAWTLAAAFSVCAGWKALSPSTRQEHHKPVVAVLTSHGLSVVGHDYPCEDSDGPDRRACQIQCSSPCIEPYRLCLAHLECGAIAVNPALSFATLKRTLPASAESFVRIIHSKREWREWLANATLTRGGKLRRVHVALHPLAGGGHDFPCPDSEGADVKACQLSCSSSSECRSAYDHCINHAPCAVIELNAPLFTWATLKAGPVNRSGTLEIADGASWHATFQKITEANREHPASPTNSAAVAHLWGHAISAPPGAWNKGYEPTVPWRPLPSDEKNAKRWLTLHQKLATLALQATKDARLSALSAGSRVSRPIHLSTSPIEGHDFPCEEAEGDSTTACQIACDDQECVDGYRACVLLEPRCQAVFVNSERHWATLKQNISSGAGPDADPTHHVVMSEDSWRLVLQHALTTGEGVLWSPRLKRPAGWFAYGRRRTRHSGWLLP